jgi:predicted nuclease with TOPRIM domain
MMDETKVMDMEKRIADLETAISDLTEMMKGTMSNAQKMSQKITELSEQPASESVIIEKTIVETKLSSIEDSKQRIFELAKKLKSK